MQKGKDKYCKHLSGLSRETLKKLTEARPSDNCSLHKNHPIYYLCLHCGQSCCLDYVSEITCLRFHFKANPTHYFALQMQLGTIYCSQCQDSIQNMIFTSGNGADDNFLKMNRFAKFIGDIWKQLEGKTGEKKKIVAHRGLKNLGNTCFLNVVLQCLYASVSLKSLYSSYQKEEGKLRYGRRCVNKEVEYFYDEVIQKNEEQRWNVVSSKKQKNQTEQNSFYKKDITNAEFNILFKNFLQSMSSQVQSTYNPQKVLDFLGFINKKYQLTQEQDAEELLLLMIDMLSEGERLSFLSDLERYKEVEKILGFQKLTPIQTVFGFYLLNEIQCNQCKEITLSVNLSYNIGLGIEKTREEDYQIKHSSQKIYIDYWQELTYPTAQGKCDLLDPFFKVERLNLSNNYYSCTKCKSLLAWRKHYIVSQPQILIVSVKRFNARLQKNIAKVAILKEIDIRGYCGSQGQTGYELYGVIVHEGKTLRTGHYICFVKLGECWLLCSDHRVQVVDWKYVQDQEAYILLYQRKNCGKSDL